MHSLVICVVVACALLSFVSTQPVFPQTFVATSIDPSLPGMKTRYADVRYGERVDYSITGKDTNVSSVYLKSPDNPQSQVEASIYYYLMGQKLDVPICVLSKSQFGPPTPLPKLQDKVGVGKVNGEMTQIWSANDMDVWYYVVNNTMGRVYPRARAERETAEVFTDFAMAIPYSEAWELPTCYSPTPSKRVSPPTYTLPPFSAQTIYDLGFSSLRVNLYTSNDMMRQDIISTVPDAGTATTTTIYSNNNVYQLIDWLDVDPVPCFYFPASGPRPIPPLFYLGTSTLDDNHSIDLYSDKDEVWVLDSLSHKPLAVLPSSTPYSINFLNFTVGVPDKSVFEVPPTCWNLSSTNNDLPSNIPTPALPTAFTLYFTNANPSYEGVIYADYTKQFLRMDIDNYVMLQRNNTMYTFTVPTSPLTIDPLPCFQTTGSFPGYQFPIPTSFDQNLGTTDFDGYLAYVWTATVSPIMREKQIWYFDVQNVPLFFYGTQMTSAVSFFQPQAPPTGVFDPPALCSTITVDKMAKMVKKVKDSRKLHLKAFGL